MMARRPMAHRPLLPGMVITDGHNADEQRRETRRFSAKPFTGNAFRPGIAEI